MPDEKQPVSKLAKKLRGYANRTSGNAQYCKDLHRAADLLEAQQLVVEWAGKIVDEAATLPQNPNGTLAVSLETAHQLLATLTCLNVEKNQGEKGKDA